MCRRLPTKAKTYGEVSVLDSVCIWNEEDGELTIFAVNKDLNEDLEVSCDLRQFSDYSVVEHIVLTDDDMKAVNTESDPNRVAPVRAGHPRMDNGRFTHRIWKAQLGTWYG